jgi:NTE family protein
MAYPGIYEPVQLNGCHFVDGGVLNPVPVSAAVQLGADVVISSVLSVPAERETAAPVSNTGRRRFILESISRTLEIMQGKIVQESCSRADVAIQPVFDQPPGLLDFKRGRQLERAGEEAAERALPKLQEVLPWLA